MKFALFITAFLGFAAAPVFAFDATDVERCKAITSDVPRLACFDAVTADAAKIETQDKTADPSTTIAPDSGSWASAVKVDPITDEPVLTAMVESEDGTTYQKQALVLRCRSGTPELYIFWQKYLADEDKVTIRIDDKPPETSNWSLSTDKQSTFAYQPDAFIKIIPQAKQVSARVTPYNSGPVTATFAVGGLDAVLAEHPGICGAK